MGAWITAVAGPAVAENTEAKPRAVLHGAFSRENFLAYVGEEFAVYGGAGAHWVVRMRLDRLEDRHRSAQVDQYTLWFRAPLDSERREKGSYFFEHPEAGRFMLWIEPAGEGSGGRYYTAQLNQLLSRPQSSSAGTQ